VKNDNTKRFKAVALCRVSTARQRAEGSSLEAQEKYVYECAAYHTADIVKMWSLDTSSKKGKNLARKDLNEIMQYCKQTKGISYLILDEVDRFMRSVDEYYWWKVEFKKIGVFLAYAKLPEITHQDNPMAVMREMMEVFRAEASNYERISKTTDKMQARVAAGY
jgi:site-specific DNA recombinase